MEQIKSVKIEQGIYPKKFYKLLLEDHIAGHGGSFRYEVPTKDKDGNWIPSGWTPTTNVQLCASGYHVVEKEFILEWILPEIYLAEAVDDYGMMPRMYRHACGPDKWVFSSIRLVKPIETWTEEVAYNMCLTLLKLITFCVTIEHMDIYRDLAKIIERARRDKSAISEYRSYIVDPYFREMTLGKDPVYISNTLFDPFHHLDNQSRRSNGGEYKRLVEDFVLTLRTIVYMRRGILSQKSPDRIQYSFTWCETLSGIMNNIFIRMLKLEE